MVGMGTAMSVTPVRADEATARWQIPGSRDLQYFQGP